MYWHVWVLYRLLTTPLELWVYEVLGFGFRITAVNNVF
jgi:hypothetical protein